MRTHRLLGLFIFVAVTALAHAARAQDETVRARPADDDAPAAADATTQLHLDVSSGFSTLGLQVGGLALLRAGIFEVGPSFDASGLVSSKAGGGIAVGVGSRGREIHAFGWDMLGEAGLHQHHAGKGLLSDDPGASATIPYGGVRLGVSWALGGPQAHLRGRHGLWLYGNVDLSSVTKQYTYQEKGWLSDTVRQAEGSAVLGGGTLFGLSYTIGFDAS